MEETSSAKVRMPDGTVLHIERIGAGNACVLSLGVHLPPLSGYAVLMVHPRGHGVSEGKWHAAKHMDDVAFLIQALRKHYAWICVVATGEQAKLLLLQERKRGVFPDAMMLLHPVPVARLHVQTPTVIFSNTFVAVWNATVRQWPAAHLECIHVLQEALRELKLAEKPIRF